MLVNSTCFLPKVETDRQQIYMIDEVLYLSILPMTKISILCFYLRVFPKKEIRMATYVVMALCVGYLISFVLISVFQCDPINGAYLRWDGEHNFKCNNINAQGWAAAIANMILDIVVMALPLRELYNLNLSLRKKLGVLCMFSLGILYVNSCKREKPSFTDEIQRHPGQYPAIGIAHQIRHDTKRHM